MGLLLTLSQICVPEPAKKRELERLFEAGAAAFQTQAPSRVGLSYEDRLRSFAQFTRSEAERHLLSKDIRNVKKSLFDGAFQLGKEYRSRFRLKTIDDTMRMARVMYGLLGIDLRGNVDGELTVRRCLFSAYYSLEVCKVISSLDEGLMAGLSGGCGLSFSERITDGSKRCRAILDVFGAHP